MIVRQLIIGSSIALSLFFGASFGFADEATSEARAPFFIRLDAPTIAKGYTVSAFNAGLKLSLVPGIISEQTGVSIRELPDLMVPWNLKRISPVYEFEFLNKSAYDNSRPFTIQFKTTEASLNYKQVFFYDKTYDTWRPLPTRDAVDGSFVRSVIHLPYARIAVFAHPNVLAIGNASWYKHKAGNFAASPDFPKGSRVRVHNSENGKFVDVTINDYGPDRSRFPTRVIDLEKEAFIKIAPLGAGLVSVRIEPLSIVGSGGRVLDMPSKGIGTQPDVSSKAAIVMDGRTGDVLYEKNAETPMPIASLTKIVAMRVFLDTNPNLKDVVTYQVGDENLTYQYVDHPYEAATLKLKDGDTLTVEDLLYSALVGSANNAVESLVRASGVPREQFIERMNAFAGGLGLSTVHFDEPTGLSPNNVSSAHDYAVLARQVLRDPIIQKASIMRRYSFATINTNEKHTLKNTNSLFTSDLAITGSKTGYLNESGYCLMTSVQGASGQVIVVTLGDKTKSASTESVRELLRFGELQAVKLARTTRESLL
ncbi:MAG: serine hydrolase [Candidatus Uhrbacteria bacterium]|nr:serine hydrolase [Candidatus Uhrbacteria bacterium]